MCGQEDLLLVGKLGGREAVAAVSCGPKGRLALLVDESSQQQFLVDTGCSYSILPHKSKQPTSGLPLCTVGWINFLETVASHGAWSEYIRTLQK